MVRRIDDLANLERADKGLRQRLATHIDFPAVLFTGTLCNGADLLVLVREDADLAQVGDFEQVDPRADGGAGIHVLFQDRPIDGRDNINVSPALIVRGIFLWFIAGLLGSHARAHDFRVAVRPRRNACFALPYAIMASFSWRSASRKACRVTVPRDANSLIRSMHLRPAAVAPGQRAVGFDQPGLCSTAWRAPGLF